MFDDAPGVMRCKKCPQAYGGNCMSVCDKVQARDCEYAPVRGCGAAYRVIFAAQQPGACFIWMALCVHRTGWIAPAHLDRFRSAAGHTPQLPHTQLNPGQSNTDEHACTCNGNDAND